MTERFPACRKCFTYPCSCKKKTARIAPKNKKLTPQEEYIEKFYKNLSKLDGATPKSKQRQKPLPHSFKHNLLLQYTDAELGASPSYWYSLLHTAFTFSRTEDQQQKLVQDIITRIQMNATMRCLKGLSSAAQRIKKQELSGEEVKFDVSKVLHDIMKEK